MRLLFLFSGLFGIYSLSYMYSIYILIHPLIKSLYHETTNTKTQQNIQVTNKKFQFALARTQTLLLSCFTKKHHYCFESFKIFFFFFLPFFSLLLVLFLCFNFVFFVVYGSLYSFLLVLCFFLFFIFDKKVSFFLVFYFAFNDVQLFVFNKIFSCYLVCCRFFCFVKQH